MVRGPREGRSGTTWTVRMRVAMAIRPTSGLAIHQRLEMSTGTSPVLIPGSEAGAEDASRNHQPATVDGASFNRPCLAAADGLRGGG